ncbi:MULTISPECIES: thiol-disulfide oxidoreductase DCC family protein [Jeotgalibacillus]|uniref:thiol-disulfide oxidoreductase DCC family protein n=1 Tax=Jeotgalibacillus TaxID=157226 RepID=UPI0010698010|nr:MULTISPECIES: DCC1-like thiol-disulfide oxidoreductase family protein [Jeotgalibacillus]TFD97641.1 DUF393 domain-containing protein [Jeotgalibacillus sp. R-1-5s-1]
MPDVVLFDGDCNVCDWSVRFIMKRDPEGHFHFASLQGEVGSKMRASYGIDPLIDSVMLIKDDKVYTKSTAVLTICKSLTGPAGFLPVFLAVPKPLRDLVYGFIAKNRFHWFGKKQACGIPTVEERRRMLD